MPPHEIVRYGYVKTFVDGCISRMKLADASSCQKRVAKVQVGDKNLHSVCVHTLGR